MTSFLEVLTGPLEVYWAPEGQTSPEIDTAPASPWALLGKSGSLSYAADSSVVLAEEGNDDPVHAAGSLYPVKYVPQPREKIMRVRVQDMSIDTFRLAWGNPAIQSQSPGVGVPGKDWIELATGLTLPVMALLLRGVGMSPETAGLNMQLYFGRAVQTGKPELTFAREAVSFELEFRALVAEDGTVGRYEVQTQPAS